ncbi:MAG: AMP-binding protein [Synergistaceae bacterium]|nr:AMP-binding protein [Synergistaceae bacterium]
MDIDRRLEEIIYEKLNKNKDDRGFWWDGKWYTNEYLLNLAESTANILSRSGFAKGQRVSVLMPNCPMVVALMIACWKLGGAINPLNVKSGADSLIGTLKLVDPFAVVVSSEIKNEAGELIENNGYPLVVCDEMGPLPEFTGKKSDPEDESLAVIFATSGTTGMPKAVPLSHLNLVANVDGMMDSLRDLKKGDALLNILPNFHSFGYSACTLLPIFCEGSQVIVPGFLPPSRAIKAIVEAPATVLIIVPAMLNYLIAAMEKGAPRPENLTMIVTGGDRYNTDMDEKLKSLMGKGNLQGYGLTETSPVLAVNKNYVENRLGTVGPFLKHVEWQLRPDENKPVVEGEGVLWVRGKSVTNRYFRDTEMTAARFDPDGWFNTGDYVSVSKDGYLTILDRVTDIIIVGGFNVYPQEVERIVNMHPAVQSSVVVGIPHPSSGEIPKIFIIKKEGAEITDVEIIHYCKKHLAHFKVPRKVEFVESWPLSGAGKILRRVLREREK